MDIAKLILNPARLRILQYIRLHGSARTSDIVKYLNDIPRATVYHHVKILEENNMIEVIKENRVRGTIEKVYALKEYTTSMEGETFVALSTAFYVGLMQEMNEYFSRKEQDHKKDNVFFSSALLYMSDNEYENLLKSIAGLLKPYIEQKPKSNLKLRKLSIISSPPVVDNDKTK
ncbi:TPA: helix-turn-helix domain-containing protein [Clostridioides difficile]|uniref:helix-turn-helix domain-containing protein n=1 Tax=Clostridioides difficile TaxID=1496 RepID=UPI00038CAC91|nr:helix-turn-helix domain-containing protein [Clostridioides difficile]EQK03783.1 bacterial regulatory, arsR family protein [Clostridioides difficile P59]MBG0192073.1 helix-turn-helix domain-containing protein [Clostridioides difficile]MBH7223672.1 helix-turn-helix domain-containing protein [Clostridioides difficile]MBY1575830.1 helix-turn-helix domain-containing protein [Clostridioides difficile]MBZ0758563.1 helix-turn-helix domain-containing protein [Clostridioides difficile]